MSFRCTLDLLLVDRCVRVCMEGVTNHAVGVDAGEGGGGGGEL